MVLERIDADFSVCRVRDYSGIKLDAAYCFIGKTKEENSLVCETKDIPDNVTDREDGWRAFRVQGVLDFSLVGILSKISGILAEKQIGIFAVSTYNTDYVFVKAENYERALAALQDAGYEVKE